MTESAMPSTSSGPLEPPVNLAEIQVGEGAHDRRQRITRVLGAEAPSSAERFIAVLAPAVLKRLLAVAADHRNPALSITETPQFLSGSVGLAARLRDGQTITSSPSSSVTEMGSSQLVQIPPMPIRRMKVPHSSHLWLPSARPPQPSHS